MAKIYRLQSARLENLKWAILRQIRRYEKSLLFPSNPYGIHPAWVEVGRLVYESSMRDFKPHEIPTPLRSCPWCFVIAQLIREWQEVEWNAAMLTKFVERYITGMAQGNTAADVAAPAPERGRVSLFEGA